MSLPYFFDTINQIESHTVPGTMKLKNNQLATYYRRWLAQRAFSVFEFKGCPEHWDVEYMKFCLMVWGTCAVIETDKFGIIPQQCTYSGYNVFYRPTRALISNPLFTKPYDLKIGEECELIRLSPDWFGIADIIGHYADMLAITTSSIIVNLFNTRLSYVFSAGSKTMAESFKALYDKVAEGNPAVFADKALFNEDGTPNWSAFQQDLNTTYIVDKLQAAESAILNDFYTYIGIPNVQFEKSERLTRTESGINNYATQCLVALWKRTLSATLEKVNALFGLSVSVDYNETLLKEMNSNNVDVRANDNSGSVQLQNRPVR